MADLTPAQRQAVGHTGGAVLVVGSAGTGKTATLAARFHRLVEGGEPPERILFLAPSAAAADGLRARLEGGLTGAWEELAVLTFPALCEKLLAEGGLQAGLDPFAIALTPADRLAMLLERVDELTIRAHDLGGDPAALLGSFVRRIDRLKEAGVTVEEHAAWAEALPAGDDAARVRARLAREFGAVWEAHERMLAEAGALDGGDLVLRAIRLLREVPHVRRRMAETWRHVLADDVPDLSFAQGLLLRLLALEHGQLAVAGDPDQAVRRMRGAATKNLDDVHAEFPDALEVRLDVSQRCPGAVVRASRAITGGVEPAVSHEGAVELWRCANERAQAQAVAGDVERLVAREGVDPSRIAVLVRSVDREGPAVGVALAERDVPHRLLGAAAFFQRAEIRDVLAWLRLLKDSGDAGAVVRALARPPIELRSVDLARCTQIARRRKLDMVAGLVAATESPQIPPEARERILLFLKTYRALAGAFETARPDLYVHRLIDRLGLRRQLVFSADPDVVERLRNFARFAELAAAHARRDPRATARDFAGYVAAVAEAAGPDDEPGMSGGEGGVAVLSMGTAKGLEWDHVYVVGLHAARLPGAREVTEEAVPDALLHETLPPDGREAHTATMRRLLNLAVTRARERVVLAYPQASERGAGQLPSPFLEDVREALGLDYEDRTEELFGPDETLHATFRALRNELLEGIQRTGSRLGELRFDTDLDVSHAVVRYLEVIKLAALIDRAPDQGPAEALPELNARLSAALTSEQREIFASSPLDELLLGAEGDASRRASAAASRAEPSLEPFLPRRGDGLVLSASDIETYRECPLRYKFARVFRIPSEPTIHQRFGIAVHQVLERFHAGEGRGTIGEMMELFDAAWRRGGFGDTEEAKQLRGKATAALSRYHERLSEEPAEPVWFERSFAFKLGPHLLRGRVDRVDKLPDGGYELIDYKTGRPKSAAQLREDVQLSLYAIAAGEAWDLDAASGSYYYVLDDERVRVDAGQTGREWITDTVYEVAEGIGAQGFEPTPSYSACSRCDYRIACPAAER